MSNGITDYLKKHQGLDIANINIDNNNKMNYVTQRVAIFAIVLSVSGILFGMLQDLFFNVWFCIVLFADFVLILIIIYVYFNRKIGDAEKKMNKSNLHFVAREGMFRYFSNMEVSSEDLDRITEFVMKEFSAEKERSKSDNEICRDLTEKAIEKLRINYKK